MNFVIIKLVFFFFFMLNLGEFFIKNMIKPERYVK
nr:MAG TPA: hypothetical protein [Caudoviricetes sp.]